MIVFKIFLVCFAIAFTFYIADWSAIQVAILSIQQEEPIVIQWKTKI